MVCKPGQRFDANCLQRFGCRTPQASWLLRQVNALRPSNPGSNRSADSFMSQPGPDLLCFQGIQINYDLIIFKKSVFARNKHADSAFCQWEQYSTSHLVLNLLRYNIINQCNLHQQPGCEEQVHGRVEPITEHVWLLCQQNR